MSDDDNNKPLYKQFQYIWVWILIPCLNFLSNCIHFSIILFTICKICIYDNSFSISVNFTFQGNDVMLRISVSVKKKTLQPIENMYVFQINFLCKKR